jgi:hypothetical protein
MHFALSPRCRVRISAITLIASTLVILFVAPMCYCPRYYIVVTAAGLLPLVLGPWLFRGLAIVYIAYGVMRVHAEYRGGALQAEQVRERAAYEAQQKAIYDARRN